MGQALYRKYRSKSLDEIVGQEHVTATLASALKKGRISHAYLLTGPRGVGKTSIARILAHEINGLPYDDAAHLDIIEIDAASNRRIDEIRELRDRVATAPASAKYKVYIIDEVHMLTKEAFNALLKTLEEPPAHVVFILATTEAYKLPETIISRTQRYSLRPIPLDRLVAHLKEIASGEKLKIDDDALALIAEHGDGSFRDSISLLDQASSSATHVTKPDIERILGLAPGSYIKQLMQALERSDSSAIVGTLSELYGMGYEPAMIAGQLSAEIRTSVLGGSAADPSGSLELLRTLLDIAPARNPKQLLELTLLKTAVPAPRPASIVPPVAVTAREATVTPGNKKPVPVEQKPPVATKQVTATPEPPKVKLPATAAASSAQNTAEPKVAMDVAELWQQTLDEIKKQYNTLYGIARMAKPEFDGSQLTLTFKFAFHQKRINEAKNRQIFADVVERLYGQPVDIICLIAEPSDETAVKPDVSTISNIFGGAELLES